MSKIQLSVSSEYIEELFKSRSESDEAQNFVSYLIEKSHVDIAYNPTADSSYRRFVTELMKSKEEIEVFLNSLNIYTTNSIKIPKKYTKRSFEEVVNKLFEDL